MTAASTFGFMVTSGGEGRVVWRCHLEGQTATHAMSDLGRASISDQWTCTVAGDLVSVERDREHAEDTFTGEVDCCTLGYADWRTLSVSTGYRVLTTPSGDTITASAISSVEFYAGNADDAARVRVAVDGRIIEISHDVRDFHAMVTQAHRRAATMTNTNRTTITCTDDRITSIKVGSETVDEIDPAWSTVGAVTRSGLTIHLAGRDGHPDVAIVAVDDDAADELLAELSTLHQRHHGWIS